MAEDKNGFLLYKDLIHSVKKLPKDKAGELFLHILSYVNDENPETDDLLIELSFEPIKQALKRDLKKYEKTKEKNRENAIKRWQKSPDKSEGMPNDATACDRMPTDANSCEAMPLDAKHADIDSGSDIGSDTDSGIDILLEKETKEENIIKENSDEYFSDHKLPEESASKKVPLKKVNEPKLEMPEDFLPIWDEWHQYRKAKRIKAYAGAKWEQIAVDKLLELSNRDPVMAKLILKQTYENNYQGFFPLKTNFNGQPNSNNANNGFSNRAGNTSNSKGGKKSASSILAARARDQASGNSESGNFTFEAEVVE